MNILFLVSPCLCLASPALVFSFLRSPLMLHQGSRSLEDHTQDFLDLSPDTHYLDKSVIVFLSC